MKKILLFVFVLIAVGCANSAKQNEQENASFESPQKIRKDPIKSIAKVEDTSVSNELNGFQRKYFDSEFREVQSKSLASYYREAYYSKGKPIADSIAKDYYITGELQFIGHIASENPDVLYGQGTWYYKNGQIESKNFVNSNGVIEGQSLSYFENGAKKIICNYSNGKLDGHYVEYYLNGHKKFDYYFRDGLTHGMCKQYYENGNLKLSSNMTNGIQDGVGHEYYESGKLSATFLCVKGVLQGELIEYYENGRIKTKGRFLNGSKTGLWEYYDTRGFCTYQNHSQINNYGISSRSNSPDDAYDEGYDNGYEQGRYDGSHGYSHGYGYDDSTSYYDYYETRYEEGYEEGYDDGYNEGLSEYEEDD